MFFSFFLKKMKKIEGNRKISSNQLDRTNTAAPSTLPVVYNWSLTAGHESSDKNGRLQSGNNRWAVSPSSALPSTASAHHGPIFSSPFICPSSNTSGIGNTNRRYYQVLLPNVPGSRPFLPGIKFSRSATSKASFTSQTNSPPSTSSSNVVQPQSTSPRADSFALKRQTLPGQNHSIVSDNQIKPLTTVDQLTVPKDDLQHSSPHSSVKKSHKRSKSPFSRLFRFVSKSSGFLDQKQKSIAKSESHQELGASNLSSEGEKKIRCLRKRSSGSTKFDGLEAGSSGKSFLTNVGPNLTKDTILPKKNSELVLEKKINPTSNQTCPPTTPKPVNHRPPTLVHLITTDSELLEINAEPSYRPQVLQTKAKQDKAIENKKPIRHPMICLCGCSLHKLKSIMISRYREILIAALLLFSILNAIHTEDLATRSAALPIKFFPHSSLIVDFEDGDLQKLSTFASQREITFVMYYAPWDAECIRFRKEYETVFKHFEDQIFFAAVNCWWPEGECGKSFQIKRFPIFLSHLRGVGEIEYKGPLVASYVIPFLDNLLNPLVPLVNERDLLDLKSVHDVRFEHIFFVFTDFLNKILFICVFRESSWVILISRNLRIRTDTRVFCMQRSNRFTLIHGEWSVLPSFPIVNLPTNSISNGRSRYKYLPGMIRPFMEEN